MLKPKQADLNSKSIKRLTAVFSLLCKRLVKNHLDLVNLTNATQLEQVSSVVICLESKLESFRTYTSRHRVAEMSKISILDRLNSNLEVTALGLNFLSFNIVELSLVENHYNYEID